MALRRTFGFKEEEVAGGWNGCLFRSCMICADRQMLLRRSVRGGGDVTCEVKKRNASKLVLPIILIIYNLFMFNNLYLISDSALYNLKKHTIIYLIFIAYRIRQA
jgi:hypothetical protein